MSAYLDIAAGAEAERHRADGLACTCGVRVWTEYHLAVMVGRRIAALIEPQGEGAAILASDIVRALADSSPNAHSRMFHECVLCGASVPVKPEHHKPDCVWRRAVEWVAET